MMRRLALAILFACAIWFSGRDYVQLVRDSLSMLRQPYEARRERALGGDYIVMQRIVREIPRDAVVTIVLKVPKDVDRGVFLSYYLYPRPTHFNEPRTGVVVLVDGGDMRVISR
jgi:hypothetical protein